MSTPRSQQGVRLRTGALAAPNPFGVLASRRRPCGRTYVSPEARKLLESTPARDGRGFKLSAADMSRPVAESTLGTGPGALRACCQSWSFDTDPASPLAENNLLPRRSRAGRSEEVGHPLACCSPVTQTTTVAAPQLSCGASCRQGRGAGVPTWLSSWWSAVRPRSRWRRSSRS